MRGTVTASALARLAKVTPQGAWKFLQGQVRSGYLVKRGSGRGSKYARSDADNGLSPAARWAGATFWEQALATAPHIGFVRLGRLDQKLRHRRQVETILGPWAKRQFVIVDLRGVKTMTGAFADELFRVWPLETACRPIPINAAPEVDAIIARVLSDRR